MKTFGLLLLPCVATLTIALSQMQPDLNPPTSHPQIYGDADAYDVYSAAVPMDKWYWQNSKTLLIVRDIPPAEWPIGSPSGALQGNADFREAFASIFRSFDETNQQKMLLEHHFTFQKPYRLISRGELDASFRHVPQNAIRDGWEGFRNSFPDSSGYLILSGVGFNADKTIALVYVEHRCANMCSQAQYYILKKSHGHWVKCVPNGLKSEMRGES
jgi:hypothetical protein